MISYNIYSKVLGLAVAVMAFGACTDSWNDHYENKGEGLSDASLWQAITQNGNLSNFAKVVEACGYDKALNSSQVFTVFAPTNEHFSAEEANELIAAYQAEKGKMMEDDNTVIKEFIQNHITMFSHSVSENSKDSLIMMNGKKTVLTSSLFGNNSILSSNQLYSNGLLYTIDGKAQYVPTVFEYLRKDADLDSVSSFFYNSRFYRKEFIPARSVAGGIVDGKTVYLDSVFAQRNELFDYDMLEADLNDEDSTYWMVVPTNEVWKKLIEEYQPYFNYDNSVRYRDSLAYTNSRMAIMGGTVFSRTLNTDAHLTDSAMSTNAVERYVARQRGWGDSNLHYYQYGGISKTNTRKPFGELGVFKDTENVECANGLVMKSRDWKIDKLNTFCKWIIIEAEDLGSTKEMSLTENEKTKEMEPSLRRIVHPVLNNNRFYGKVWGNSFVEFEQIATMNHWVTFNIEDVLSNIGYDIYLVTAPVLANDSNATDIQRVPMKVTCTLGYNDQDGKHKEEKLKTRITTTADEVNYLLLAEDFKFPCSSYGLNEVESQVTLTVATDLTAREERNHLFTRTMMIDCIMLIPHGIARVDEEGFEIEPHGDGDVFYWLKK